MPGVSPCSADLAGLGFVLAKNIPEQRSRLHEPTSQDFCASLGRFHQVFVACVSRTLLLRSCFVWSFLRLRRRLVGEIVHPSLSKPSIDQLRHLEPKTSRNILGTRLAIKTRSGGASTNAATRTRILNQARAKSDTGCCQIPGFGPFSHPDECRPRCLTNRFCTGMFHLKAALAKLGGISGRRPFATVPCVWKNVGWFAIMTASPQCRAQACETLAEISLSTLLSCSLCRSQRVLALRSF